MNGPRIAAHLIVYGLFACGCWMVADGMGMNQKTSAGIAIVGFCMARNLMGIEDNDHT